MNDFIIETRSKGDKAITGKLLVPNHLKKYVKNTEYFIEYDKKTSDEPSIINIPLLSNILPLAWITDTDIRVETLDKKHLEAMSLLKHEINKIFPLKKFKTEIKVDEIVENSVEADGVGLLFSGGVDSTYSLISNWEKKPHLIMIWGIDMHPYPEYSQHWNELEKVYKEFAKKHGLEFSMIKTNASQILNYPRIDHDFHRILHSGRFRLRHQHSLIIIPIVAPFSINRFNKLLFAAGDWPSLPLYRDSIVSIPRTDEKIVWADLETKHDGFIPRIDKLKAITEFTHVQDITLKVCQYPVINCCSANKCYKVIMYLALNGINPKDFGFNVTEKVYDEMRQYYEKALKTYDINDEYFSSLKEMIPEKIDGALKEARPFFSWLVNQDLDINFKDTWRFRVIYNQLPYSLASRYDKILSKMRINIHPSSFDLDHFPELIEMKHQYDYI